MYLKSLSIQGFKSFSSKFDVHFDSPISSIVGPNGSGKSNIAEAFKFVLGEQSIKSLRGKKGSDLIFNGGSGGKRVNRASVEVVFDNLENVLDIEYDEVVLERVVNRDGTNEYLINGSNVRLKDITELLAKANIGPSGHHIISQGEADRLLNSNQKERRGILEDALGLRHYQMKKNESEKRLDKTVKNMKEVELLRREIAPQLKYLKKQVEKFEESKQIRSSLQESYKEYLAREEKYIFLNRKDIESSLKGPYEKKTELNLYIRELEEKIDNLNKEVKKDNDTEEVDRINNEIQGLRSRMNSVMKDIGVLEGKIEVLESVSINQPEETINDRQISFSRIKKFVTTFFERTNDADIDINSLKEAIKSFKGTWESEFDTDIVDDNKPVVDNSNNISEVRSEILEKENEYKELQLKEEELITKQRSLSQNDIEEKNKSLELERNLYAFKKDLSDTEREIALLRQRMETLDRDQEIFRDELNEARALLGEYGVQYEKVEDNINIISEDRSEQRNRFRDIERMKLKLESMGASAESQDELFDEYKELQDRDDHFNTELIDLKKSGESLEKLVEELGDKLKNEFAIGIKKINESFGSYFNLMFGGGESSLTLTSETVTDEDGEEEIKEGIDINVNLPRKNIKSLMMLSGGERALTSIALLFAMSAVNPPPFIILDETDAALDEANSRKYGDMIENLARQSQLILITHNRETMSRAGVLYGVSMGNTGASQVLSIKLDDAVTIAK